MIWADPMVGIWAELGAFTRPVWQYDFLSCISLRIIGATTFFWTTFSGMTFIVAFNTVVIYCSAKSFQFLCFFCWVSLCSMSWRPLIGLPWTLKSGNTNWRGRPRYAWPPYVKKSWSKLGSTRRSTVVSLLLQWGFSDLTEGGGSLQLASILR